MPRSVPRLCTVSLLFTEQSVYSLFLQPFLPNIVGTRENIASFGTLIHDKLTLAVTYPNKNASGTLRLLKDIAVVEITSVPEEVNYRGEQPAPRTFPKECLPCYEVDPTDADVCIHQELYYGDPRASGHSYKRSSFDMYSEAQRLEWRSRLVFGLHFIGHQIFMMMLARYLK